MTLMLPIVEIELVWRIFQKPEDVFAEAKRRGVRVRAADLLFRTCALAKLFDLAAAAYEEGRALDFEVELGRHRRYLSCLEFEEIRERYFSLFELPDMAPIPELITRLFKRDIEVRLRDLRERINESADESEQIALAMEHKRLLEDARAVWK